MLFTLYTTILFFSSLLSTAMFVRNVYTVYVHRKAWRLVQQNVINVLPVDWYLNEHLSHQAPQRAVQENPKTTTKWGSPEIWTRAPEGNQASTSGYSHNKYINESPQPRWSPCTLQGTRGSHTTWGPTRDHHVYSGYIDITWAHERPPRLLGLYRYYMGPRETTTSTRAI